MGPQIRKIKGGSMEFFHSNGPKTFVPLSWGTLKEKGEKEQDLDFGKVIVAKGSFRVSTFPNRPLFYLILSGEYKKKGFEKGKQGGTLILVGKTRIRIIKERDENGAWSYKVEELKVD